MFRLDSALGTRNSAPKVLFEEDKVGEFLGHKKPKKKIKNIMDDLPVDEPWRVFRIMSEFVDGFETLRGVGKAVSIFGGARLKPSNEYYLKAKQTAQLFAKSGYSVITGGGSGIMEASNRGAKFAK